jgi:hypothetical protein
VAAAKPATMPGAIRKGFCIFGEGSCSNKAKRGGIPDLCKSARRRAAVPPPRRLQPER